MATIKELKELALHAARGTAPANFTVETVDETLRAELSKMASSINEFQRNKYDIFDIIIETIEEVVPKRVSNALDAFAEVRVVPNGQKAIFKLKTGKQRAKKFLTRVGLSGVYETFRLDSKTFTVEPDALGIGATLDFERMLDGSEAIADTMDAITEAFADGIFNKVQMALRAALNATGRPAANKVTGSYSAANLFKLVSVVRAYGNGAIILAPPEFIGAMGPMAFTRLMTLKPFTELATSIFSAVLPLFRFRSLTQTRRIQQLGLTRRQLMSFRQAERRLLRSFLKVRLRCGIGPIEISPLRLWHTRKLVLLY